MKATDKLFDFVFTVLLIVLLVTVVTQVVIISGKEPEVVVETHVIHIKQTVSHLVKERVEFTNYYINDGYGTGITTSSGITVESFKVNERGWYTWEGYVVIATATNLCIDVTNGACGKYNEHKDTHHYFDLFDTLTIIVDNQEYSAIVLDSCGACNWDEEFQRVDIFIAHPKYTFGKKKGAIIY